MFRELTLPGIKRSIGDRLASVRSVSHSWCQRKGYIPILMFAINP